MLHEKQLSLILHTMQGKRTHRHDSDGEHSAHSNVKRGRRRFLKTSRTPCDVSSSSSSEEEQPRLDVPSRSSRHVAPTPVLDDEPISVVVNPTDTVVPRILPPSHRFRCS